ncbi:MAG: TIGR04282 family arsenosugar biosynthesis glycosyltransferase [Magnetococcales bacterium]|nr:TIGR04282 family arsenosugar biosynthesis glycosyltransferase [Magnetococcales bacterium]
MAQISLHLMGKVPVAGLVKTRLIPELGAAGAARAQVRLLRQVATMARLWCQARPGRLFRLWFTPDTGHPLCAALAEPDELRVQPPGDLGQRMAAIVDVALAETDLMLLIGSDAVSLTPVDLDAAEQALALVPAVLGPTEDGGYLLLGLRQAAPSLFQGMIWSTPGVAMATRARLAALGWSWYELSRQWDVDTPADWYRFLQGDQTGG